MYLPRKREMLGSILDRGSYLRQVFFTLIAYVDPELIGYLDVRLARSILGTWRHCDMVDNVSYIQGPAQALVIIHHPHVSTASLSRGGGEGREGEGVKGAGRDKG